MYINSRLRPSIFSPRGRLTGFLDGEFGGSRTQVDIENLRERVKILL